MTPTEQEVIDKAREAMRQYDIDPDVYVGMFGGYGYWLEDARAELEAEREG